MGVLPSHHFMAQQKSFGKTIIHLGAGAKKEAPAKESPTAQDERKDERKSDRPGEGNILVSRRVSLTPPPPEQGEAAPSAERTLGRTLIGVSAVRPEDMRPPVTNRNFPDHKPEPPAHEQAPVKKQVFGRTILGGSNVASPGPTQSSSPPTQQSNQLRENPKAVFSSTVQGGTAPAFLQTLNPYRTTTAAKDEDDQPVPSVRLASEVRQELSELNSAIQSSKQPGVRQDSTPPVAKKEETSELPRVGRYEVLARLKRGGMGSVYLCRISGSAGFQRLFAMKVLSAASQGTQGPRALEAFFREAQLLAQLHHPNIVGIVDIGTPTEPYLVLDYVEGGSLYDLCSRSPTRRDPKKIVTILLDALAGLDAAHRAVDDEGHSLGLVHCDLTPHNLLVGTDGACRVADFGIARGHADAQGKSSDPLWGKPGYMAPEQILGKPVDQRADIFSLGVVLYSALTGVEPFAADSTGETLKNVIDKAVEPPSQVGLCPPPSLDWVCMTALEKDPAARFQSADEMLSQLRRVVARQEFFASPSEVASWVNETMGEKLEDRRKLVRRAADPARNSEAPPAPAALSGSNRAEKSDIAPPPPSSRTKWEATVMLTAEEQAAAAQSLTEDDVNSSYPETRDSQAKAGIPGRSSANKKLMYGALAAAVLMIAASLLFPQAFGKLFKTKQSPMAEQDPSLKIDVQANSKEPTSKEGAPQEKQPGAGEDNPDRVKLPPIKTASD